MKVNTPIFASLHAVPPASLSFLEGIPGIDYEEETLTFVTDDFGRPTMAWWRSSGWRESDTFESLQEVIRSREDAGEIMAGFRQALDQRWYDQESGRYERPEPSDDAEDEDRQFHGYQ